jgi:hypothetical protein
MGVTGRYVEVSVEAIKKFGWLLLLRSQGLVLPRYLMDNDYRLETSRAAVSKTDYYIFLKFLVKFSFLLLSLDTNFVTNSVQVFINTFKHLHLQESAFHSIFVQFFTFVDYMGWTKNIGMEIRPSC